MKNVIRYENEAGTRSFLLTPFPGSCRKDSYASRIRGILCELGRQDVDLVIDAAEKTYVGKTGLKEILKITDLLADIFVLGIYYNMKEDALYVELLRHVEKPQRRKQEIA